MSSVSLVVPLLYHSLCHYCTSCTSLVVQVVPLLYLSLYSFNSHHQGSFQCSDNDSLSAVRRQNNHFLYCLLVTTVDYITFGNSSSSDQVYRGVKMDQRSDSSLSWNSLNQKQLSTLPTEWWLLQHYVQPANHLYITESWFFNNNLRPNWEGISSSNVFHTLYCLFIADYIKICVSQKIGAVCPIPSSNMHLPSFCLKPSLCDYLIFSQIFREIIYCVIGLSVKVDCMYRPPAPPVSHCVRPHPPACDPLPVQNQPPLRLNLKKSNF